MMPQRKAPKDRPQPGTKPQNPTFQPIFAAKSKDGAGDGDRTRDVQLGKLAFYR
jgi:hypothetical protein